MITKPGVRELRKGFQRQRTGSGMGRFQNGSQGFENKKPENLKMGYEVNPELSLAKELELLLIFKDVSNMST